MIRISIPEGPTLYLLPDDKRKCKCISYYVVIQCIIMFIGSITIFECFWVPDKASFDYYKLASIMYLYDKKACGYSMAAKSVANLQLSNDTKGLNVLPIKWEPAVVTASTRLSTKTRKYVKASLVIHVLWMILAIAFSIAIKNNNNPNCLKVVMIYFLYSCYFVILFDLSMAIVYVAHIQQSLTKGMIVRYSGWSVLLKLENANDFAGWLPIIASACWLRGFIFLVINIYACRIIRRISSKFKKNQFRQWLIRDGYLPFPEAQREGALEDRVLYYRPGELKPYVKNIEP